MRCWRPGLGRLAARRSADGPATGETCFLGVRPEDIRIVSDGDGAADNAVEGKAVSSQYTGEAVIYTVQVGDARDTGQGAPQPDRQRRCDRHRRARCPPQHCTRGPADVDRRPAPLMMKMSASRRSSLR